MNRKEFQKLAKIRLREAKLLVAASAPDGAYYLAGYSVECALKACIAKSTERHDFPDKVRVNRSHTHNMRELISVAGLKDAHVEAVRQYEFSWRWDIMMQWSEESRYRENPLDDAKALIEAIENRDHGILQWLKKHY
jgi:HEPN domain-containing protein